MSGHGTILTGGDAQGSATIYVSDNGGSENYSVGQTECENGCGHTINEGDVVITDWDNQVCATKMGNPATGEVSADGRTFRVTDPGHTGLSGSVSISTTHGSNGGFGGETDVSAGNVNGEAAYLR